MDEKSDERLKAMLWGVAALTVLYTLSIGPAFRYAGRACFAYYQPIRWIIGQWAPFTDSFCAYINWWTNL